jgi:hypothetical protein
MHSFDSDAVYFSKYVLMFRRNVLPPPSDSEERGRKFLRNSGTYPRNYMASNSKRLILPQYRLLISTTNILCMLPLKVEPMLY